MKIFIDIPVIDALFCDVTLEAIGNAGIMKSEKKSLQIINILTALLQGEDVSAELGSDLCFPIRGRWPEPANRPEGDEFGRVISLASKVLSRQMGAEADFAAIWSLATYGGAEELRELRFVLQATCEGRASHSSSAAVAAIVAIGGAVGFDILFDFAATVGDDRIAANAVRSAELIRADGRQSFEISSSQMRSNARNHSESRSAAYQDFSDGSTLQRELCHGENDESIRLCDSIKSLGLEF